MAAHIKHGGSSIFLFVALGCICTVFCLEPNGEGFDKNCYNVGLYDGLVTAIETINEMTGTEEEFEVKDQQRPPSTHSASFKKFQEDEDEGGGGTGISDFEVPPIVPMIFKVIGSAFTLNSTAVVENSLGVIPPRLSNQITTVLGNLASTILGRPLIPTTTKGPVRRRRRTTTTPKPSSSTPIANTSEGATELSNSTRNSTEPEPEPTTPTEPEPSTTEMLFKEGSLGELPVYASAYAPNYVATTPYPIYASSYLHVLWNAPTTTTVPTTTTTTTPSTTTDPNSYAIALPFDYQEIRTQPPPGSPFFPPDLINMGNLGNDTLLGTTAPPDYEEYEYEEGTEESPNNNNNLINKYNSNNINNSSKGSMEEVMRSGFDLTTGSSPNTENFPASSIAPLVISSETPGAEGNNSRKLENGDDEHVHRNTKINRTLGKISKYL